MTGHHEARHYYIFENIYEGEYLWIVEMWKHCTSKQVKVLFWEETCGQQWDI